MNELKELIKKASNRLNSRVSISFDVDGWNAFKTGLMCEDLRDATFDACVAKLKEWAMPPKPDTMTIANIPTAHIEWYARNGSNPVFSDLCKEALKPYGVQS